MYTVPIYEFRCQACNKKFSDLLPVSANLSEVSCPQCHSHNVAKLVSRFIRNRSEDESLDTIADQLEGMGEPDSTQKMRKLVRDMGKAMDEDCADEMEQMLESDLEGNLPEED